MKAEKKQKKITEACSPQDTYLFEVSWEVCNQEGGIYTVLRSKVPSVIQR